MTRAATTEELAIYRSDGLAARLFAFIDQPVTVYQCQVNQVFTTHDKVAEVSYTGATGTLADALPGMTVLVGSTAGAHDKGLARLRKTWSASVAYLGEMSEIDWETGLYLTVVDDFSVWPRHLRVSTSSVLMDYDVAYGDQNANATPIPCLGPDRVLKLTDAEVTTLLDASASWVPGSTISAYSWAVLRGPASLTNAATATPTLTADDTGRILLACTVTAANGKSATGYRNVYVWDPDSPPTEIVLDDLTGSYERGGFEFSFETFIAPGFTLRDFTKVVLFADEYPQSIGPVAGAENVLAIGWMDERLCEVNSQDGIANISVKGAHYWLSKMQGFPSGIENVSGTPAAWTQIQGLTVDKMLAHFITWRTTLSNCCDFFPTGDTRAAPALKAPVGNLWQQIKVIADDSILASPMCDPYSRLFVQVDGNYLPDDDRSAIPTVIDLTKDDYSRVSFSKRTPEASLADVSGVNSSGSPYLALSPGNVWSRLGTPIIKDKLLIGSQAQAESMAGLIFGREKREIDSIDIGLVSPIRLITLAPRQYLELTVAAGDTPAGITFDGWVLPREVSLAHDATTGELRMNVSAEPETFPAPAIKKDPPVDLGSGFFPFPPLPPLPPPPPPPPDIPTLETIKAVIAHCYNGLYVTFNIAEDAPTAWYSLNGELEGTLDARLFLLISAHKIGGYDVFAQSSTAVYRAMVLGEGAVSGLQKVLDIDRINADILGAGNQIYGIATHPVTGVSTVLAGRANPLKQFFYTSADGVSWTKATVSVNPISWGFDYMRSISFGENLLANCNPGGAGAVERILSSDYGQTSISYGNTLGVGNHYHNRIGIVGDRIIFFSSGNIKISADNGLTATDVVFDINAPGNMYAPFRVAFDPYGDFGITSPSPYTGKFQTSVDGGFGWAESGTIYNEGTGVLGDEKDGLGVNPTLAVAYVDDAQKVIVAGAYEITFAVGSGGKKNGKIMISADGSTWIDKTGNLREIGAFDEYEGNQAGLLCKQIEILYDD